MQLSDEELHEILARAEAIQRSSPATPAAEAEFAVVVQAAQEVGISREAVERALEERYALQYRPPAVGDLVFSRSADGRSYPARVTATEGGRVAVEFLRGGRHTVSPDELRPCSLTPGEKVRVSWPGWGPWPVSVVSYDAAKGRVKVTDGWYQKTFPVAEVWLEPPSPAGRTRWRWAAHAGWLSAGTLLGLVLSRLIV